VRTLTQLLTHCADVNMTMICFYDVMSRNRLRNPAASQTLSWT
jgi:hypothetical protein